MALAGAPNVGKSTLFTSLTGARQQVGNWPGTTVEVGRGRWRLPSGEVALIDLPGAYSLDAVSPDDDLARAHLLAGVDEGGPHLVLVTVDATSLGRGLYLLAQLRERSRRLVVVLTMTDVAARRGLVVDPVTLALAVGVPVVALDPRRAAGSPALARTVQATLEGPAPAPRVAEPGGQDEPGAAGQAAGEAELALADERFSWIQDVLEAAVGRSGGDGRTWSDRLDRVALSPVGGPILFAAAMWLVFQATTTVAAPLQSLLAELFAGPVGAAAGAVIEAVGLGGTWVEGLVVDGLIAGVGM